MIRARVKAGDATPVDSLLLEGAEVLLEGGYAALDFEVRVRRKLDLDSFETDAEMLQLLVILLEFLLSVDNCQCHPVHVCLLPGGHGWMDVQVGNAVLEKDDPLSCALGTFDEEGVNMLFKGEGKRSAVCCSLAVSSMKCGPSLTTYIGLFEPRLEVINDNG